jgi:hypothetical protein
LERMTYWLSERRWRADVPLFLEVVRPARLMDGVAAARPLIAERSVRERLIDGWACVMDLAPPDMWAARARSWLQACVDDPRCSPFLDVLVEAAHNSSRGCSGWLYVLARDWAQLGTDRRPSRVVVGELLTRMIDLRQGITEESVR